MSRSPLYGPRTRRVLSVAVAVAVLPGLSACDDQPLMAEGAFGDGSLDPVFEAVEQLPSPGELLDPEPRSWTTVAALWDLSWETTSGDGGAVRGQVYDDLVSGIPASVRVASSAVEDIREALDAAEQAVEAQPPFFAAAVESARAHLESADQASGLGGSERDAAMSVLLAADALRTLSARGIAWTLIERSQTELASTPTGVDAPERATRARRLVSWAVSAAENGDYPKAIQRAYYACLLLGVDTL